MNPAEIFRDVIAEGRDVREAEEGIYSVLPDASHRHLYDRRAAVYDLLVSTRVYNRVMWGTLPSFYAAFARDALASAAAGPMLDAGCGSLLFTSRAYLESARPVVASDQSLRMLQRARARLAAPSGSLPAHVRLLQADLGDLPFRPASFQTVLCLNVLHQFADAPKLIGDLNGLLADGGRLFLTSLVLNRRFPGDPYLRALHAAGEFVRPRTADELKRILDASLTRPFHYHTAGNMAFAATEA
jgi:SAM-dependent methyltransferase